MTAASAPAANEGRRDCRSETCSLNKAESSQRPKLDHVFERPGRFVALSSGADYLTAILIGLARPFPSGTFHGPRYY
jgi:hypothetical protein